MQITKNKDLYRFLRRTRSSFKGCWIWRGHKNAGEYGVFKWLGQMRLAHQFSAFIWLEPPPSPLHEIDHLCRVRDCVNPDHLEWVTSKENSRRGSRQSDVTCRNGHPRTEENTYVDKKRNKRQCLDCIKVKYWKHPEKMREEARARYAKKAIS